MFTDYRLTKEEIKKNQIAGGDQFNANLECNSSHKGELVHLYIHSPLLYQYNKDVASHSSGVYHQVRDFKLMTPIEVEALIQDVEIGRKDGPS